VSLTYVTSLVDFGKLRRSMDTQVNEYLRRRGLREIAVRELSGDTTFDDVRITLDHLTGSGSTEGVIATSMVSHGVDVDRLNVMVFNGMPKSMAEYIQASSRVGRRFLGIVFMIFNPVRERDRSHFRYHAKFHEYLDRMVEPVAINRWSRHAAKKTLPGVLMADILQVANRDFWEKGQAPAHLHDLSRMQQALRPPESGGLESVRPEALLEALAEAYAADRDEAAELRPELHERVHDAVTSIRSAGAAASAALGGRPQYRGTGDYLGLEHTPMTSLRDIADDIPFYVLPERRRR
jgi:superfamily II DNA/RNA helicase